MYLTAEIIAAATLDRGTASNLGIEPLPLKLKNAPCLDRANLNIEPKPLKRSNHGR